MTSLTQHLPIIENAASEETGNLPQKVAEVITESRDFHRKVEAFLEHVEQKGAAADALLDRVEKAVRALKAQAEQEQPDLAKALKEVEDEVEEALGVQERRSEEHTSELQSQSNLVCRLLLEKKKKNK